MKKLNSFWIYYYKGNVIIDSLKKTSLTSCIFLLVYYQDLSRKPLN